MTGKAPAAGFEFQARLAAYVAVHILADRRLRWTPLEAGDVPVAVRAESGGAGDDLRIELAGTPVVYECQAKRGLSADERLDGAVDRFAKGLLAQPSERGVLLVDATATKTIVPDLRESLNVWRGGVRDKARGALGRVIGRLKAAGALAVAERLYVQQVDVEGDATEAVLGVIATLESILDDRDQASAAWNVLIADGLRLCREGGARTASGLKDVLGLASIVLSGAPSGTGRRLAGMQATLDEMVVVMRASSIASGATSGITAAPAHALTADLDAAKRLLDSGEPAAALSLLRAREGSVTAQVPDGVRSRFYNLLGVSLLRLDQMTDAHVALRQAVELAPTDPTALTNIANVELLLHDDEQALTYANRLLAVDPNSIPGWLVKIQMEPRAEIPEQLRSDPQVLAARANAKMREQQWAEAVALLREALAVGGFEPQRALMLAQAMLAEAGERENPAMAAEELEEANRLADQAVEDVVTGAKRLLIERAFATRGQIRRQLGDREGSSADFAAAHRSNTTSAFAAFLVSDGYLSAGRPELALAAIHGVPPERHTPQLLVMEAHALAALGREAEVEQTLRAAEARTLGTDAEIDVTELIVEAALDAGLLTYAEELLARISSAASSRNWSLLRARIAAQHGDDPAARQNYETAIGAAEPGSKRVVQGEFADYLRRQGAVSDALAVLEAASAGMRGSALRPLYARVLMEAGEVAKAASLVEQLRSEVASPPRDLPIWALQLGAYVSLVSEDVPAETGYLRELLARSPQSVEAALRLAQALLRNHELSEGVRLLDTLRERGDVAPRQLLTIATLYIRGGEAKHALPLAYRAVRAEPDAEDVQLAYINVFLRRERDEPGLEPTVVGVNTFVQLMTDQGDSTGYFIVPRGEANRRANELPEDDTTAVQLLGRHVGDTITLRPGALTEARATITDIKSHYVHLFQDTLLHFQEWHPESTALQKFKVPENPVLEDFKPLTDTLAARRQTAETVFGQYEKVPLPLGAVANLLGVGIPEVYEWLAADRDRPLFVEFEDMLDQAREAATSEAPAVVTRSALVTGQRLGVLDLVPMVHRGALLVPRSLLDGLDQERGELEQRAERGYLSAAHHDGVIVSQEVPAEHFRRALEAHDQLVAWINQHCQAKPRPIASFNTADQVNREMLGESSYDSLWLAKEHDGELYADDLGLRVFARDRTGHVGFSTFALLQQANAKNLLAGREFDRRTAELLAMNHQAIQMRPSTFSVAIQDESYRLTPRVALLLERLRALAIPPTTLVLFSTELLRELAVGPAGSANLSAIAFAVIEAVAAGRDPKVVLSLFQRVVPLRFSVLPLEQDAVLDALRRFVRFKILGERALL